MKTKKSAVCWKRFFARRENHFDEIVEKFNSVTDWCMLRDVSACFSPQSFFDLCNVFGPFDGLQNLAKSFVKHA